MKHYKRKYNIVTIKGTKAQEKLLTFTKMLERSRQSCNGASKSTFGVNLGMIYTRYHPNLIKCQPIRFLIYLREGRLGLPESNGLFARQPQGSQIRIRS